jgi:hypothetical protein
LRQALLADDVGDEEGIRQTYEDKDMQESEIDSFIEVLYDCKPAALRTARVFRITLSCRPVDETVTPRVCFLDTQQQVSHLGALQDFYLDNGTGPHDLPDEDTQLSLCEKLISVLGKDDETAQLQSRSLSQLSQRRTSPESNTNRNPIDLHSIYTSLCAKANQGIYILRTVG